MESQPNSGQPFLLNFMFSKNFPSVLERAFLTPGNLPDKKRTKEDEKLIDNFFRTFILLERTLFLGFALCLDAMADVFISFMRPIFVVLFKRKRVLTTLRRDAIVVVLVMQTLYFSSFVHHSKVYHFIRGQSILKLYVIFGVIQIFDVLLSAFGTKLIRVFLAKPIWENPKAFIKLYFKASLYSIIHCLVLLTQLVTLNAVINSKTDVIFSVFFLNNVAEVKGYVFKTYSSVRLKKMLSLDIVERFNSTCLLLLISIHHLVNIQFDPRWAARFTKLALFYIVIEMAVDFIKHAWVGLYNNIDPEFYNGVFKCLCLDYSNMVDENESTTIPERFLLPVIPLSSLVLKVMKKVLVPQNNSFIIIYSIFIFLLAKLLLTIFLISVAKNVIEGRKKAKNK